MRSARVFTLGLILLVAADNAGAASKGQGALRPRQLAELLFGRDIGSKVGVSEPAWRHFVAREMTPRFPDGLTITDAMGQWRDTKDGKIVREPSKRVEIVLPGRDDDASRLAAIIKAYKRQFHQQAVALIVQSACVMF
jgi:hypothetical protein